MDKTDTTLLFFFRFALIRDGGIYKAFENRHPQTISEGKSINTEVDFGQLGNDLEIQIKITIAIYCHT